MSGAVEVQGMDELMSKLKSLGPTKDEMMEILNNPGRTLRAAMKRKAPKDEGTLTDAIVIVDKSEGTDFAIGVGVFEPETVNYAIYQEFGTGKYATGPGGSRAKKIPWLWEVRSAKWAAIFGIEVGEKVLWYGNQPHPFVRPAWDEELSNIQKQINDGTLKIIKQRMSG